MMTFKSQAINFGGEQILVIPSVTRDLLQTVKPLQPSRFVFRTLGIFDFNLFNALSLKKKVSRKN